jgi:exodeoxyribonuclease VII small subunit
VSERETAQRRPRSTSSRRARSAPDAELANGDVPNADVASGDAANGAAGRLGLTYEQARDELVDVVHRLETGGTTLEESLRLWERGEELAAVCQSWLDGARARLEAARADLPADEKEDLDHS